MRIKYQMLYSDLSKKYRLIHSPKTSPYNISQYVERVSWLYVRTHSAPLNPTYNHRKLHEEIKFDKIEQRSNKIFSHWRESYIYYPITPFRWTQTLIDEKFRFEKISSRGKPCTVYLKVRKFLTGNFCSI